jgi:hypothetical protein
MADVTYPPLFDGSVAAAATQYIHVPISNGKLGVSLHWTDTTTAGTFTLEFTSMGPLDAPVTTAGTYQWKDSGLTLTSPTGGSAGGSLVNVENVRQRRARLKFVATANSAIKVFNGAVSQT